MNLGNILIGIVLVAICLAPFLVLSYQRKNVKKNRLKTLFLDAAKLDCKIKEYEFCGDYLIGIDNEKGVLFFNKENLEENIKTQFV